MAEVTLVFENEDRGLPIDFSEVAPGESRFVFMKASASSCGTNTGGGCGGCGGGSCGS